MIDVRQPDEYRLGHVPAARLIPLAEVPDHVNELAGLATPGTDERVYLVCRTGSVQRHGGGVPGRAGRGRGQRGRRDGGLVEAGHEVVTGDQPT